jgi:hypothetical protein
MLTPTQIAGQDIQKFSEKLKETKFSEFSTLSNKQLEELDSVLNVDIPALMDELPSEKDSPETLRAKMATSSMGGGASAVPLPTRASKFGKKNDFESNPFGASEEDESYWALEDSAKKLRRSFEALGPEGGFLPPETARDVLVKTGLKKEQLRLIWNLSDIDRDGYFDLDEYVVAMFLCDAVIQKGRPIPTELPASVVPPSKRAIIAERNAARVASF